MGLLTVSPSPHDHTDETVSHLMYGVIIALLPAFAVSLYFFGIGALLVTGAAILSCVLFEYLIQRFMLKQPPAVSDGSAVVTGILLAFCLPANIPLWMVISGSFVAIGVGKMSFGGLGTNPFNPALVGRVFLFVSFPVHMSRYPEPLVNRFNYLDASTGATPLSLLQTGTSRGDSMGEILTKTPVYEQMLIGNMGGSAGEVAAAALLLGFAYLLIRGIISWHIPVSILLTVTLFTGILWWLDPASFADPVFHLLTGGLILGAVYMATDYVTSPMNHAGMLIYGAGIGIITVVIRIFGSYPEGVQFAILIMNAFTPLINKYLKPARFGEEVNRG